LIKFHQNVTLLSLQDVENENHLGSSQSSVMSCNFSH